MLNARVGMIFLISLSIIFSFVGSGLSQEVGKANVEVKGDFEFYAPVPVRFGALIIPIDGHSFFAFGEEEGLQPLFHLKLLGSWTPEPEPETIAYVMEKGVTRELLGLYFSVNTYEAQIMTLVPPEILREVVSSGKGLDLELLEAAIPAHVVADLKRLDAAKEEGYQAYRAEVTVLDVKGFGEIVQSKGRGVLQIKAEQNFAEETAYYSGKFWGDFAGAFGHGTFEGDFFSVPYIVQEQFGRESRVENWDLKAEEASQSILEERWERLYPVTGLFFNVAKPLEELSHHLKVHLLGEDGNWYQIYDVLLEPGMTELEILKSPNLQYELPEPFSSAGVRFELWGRPFMGENWILGVSSGEIKGVGGEYSREWRYTHGW